MCSFVIKCISKILKLQCTLSVSSAKSRIEEVAALVMFSRGMRRIYGARSNVTAYDCLILR